MVLKLDDCSSDKFAWRYMARVSRESGRLPGHPRLSPCWITREARLMPEDLLDVVAITVDPRARAAASRLNMLRIGLL